MKPLNYQSVKRLFSTRSGNRTHTTLLLLDFESSASTNSAIRASLQTGCKNNGKFLCTKDFNQYLVLSPILNLNQQLKSTAKNLFKLNTFFNCLNFNLLLVS